MSIKRINPNSVIKLVSIHDDAIDRMNPETNLKSYSETGDIKFLRFLTDKTPTFFLSRPLKVDDVSDIARDHMVIDPGQTVINGEKAAARIKVVDQSKMMIRYFKASVTETEEAGIVQKMDIAEIPAAVVIEIGAYVYLQTNLTSIEKN